MPAEGRPGGAGGRLRAAGARADPATRAGAGGSPTGWSQLLSEPRSRRGQASSESAGLARGSSAPWQAGGRGPIGAGLGSAAEEPVPWYRRRGWLVAVAVVLVAAIAVVVDLPRRNTPALRRQDLASFLSGLETEVGQCNAGLHDAVHAYNDATAVPRTLPMSTAATYTQDGISACSFTNSGVVALASQQAPRTLLPLGVAKLPSQVGVWAAYQAFTALQDLKVVIAHPSSATAVATYDKRIAALNAQRAAIEHEITSAQHLAGARPADLPLTQVGALPKQAVGSHG